MNFKIQYFTAQAKDMKIRASEARRINTLRLGLIYLKEVANFTYLGTDLNNTNPVSYTHLDVYKRQHKHGS